MAMGSCLVVTMSAFALDMIECKLAECPVTPKFYKRYVYDVFAIFSNNDEADVFLSYLNSHIPSLQFTIEKAVNRSLCFLDVDV